MQKQLLILLFFYSCLGWSSDRPSWYPQKPCREEWRALIPQNLHHYDSTRDGSYNNYAARVKRSQCYKDWAVLVYIEAENDLSPYALLDLYEMEAGYVSDERRAASTLKTDLIVEADTAGADGIRRYHMFQSKKPYNDRLQIADIKNWTIKNIESPVINLIDEVSEKRNFKISQRLEKFLDWGMRNYPAEHYMVILWGHGQGWTAAPADTHGGIRGRGFGGVLFDHVSGSYLDIPTLRDVLTSTTQKTLEGRKIDIYASDACLMQMFEVSTEIASSTKFIVGSTQIQNFVGLPYRRLFYELNSGNFNGLRREFNYDDEPYLVSMIIPDLFKSSLAGQGLQGRMAPEGREWLTMNAISSSELIDVFLPEFKKVVHAMKNYLLESVEHKASLRIALKNTPGVVGGAKDLNAFLTLIKYELREETSMNNGLQTNAGLALATAIDNAQAALLRAVMNRSMGRQYETPELRSLGFRAFSIWLPETQQEFQSRVNDFDKSILYSHLKSTGWSDLLALLAR